VQRLQDDQIPVSERDIAVEVVEPIIEAKKNEASLKGLKLANADMSHTAVLVDLSFLERKLKRATGLMAKPQEASAELAQARSQGRSVLRPQRGQSSGRGATCASPSGMNGAGEEIRRRKANLQLEKIQLGAYRALVDETNCPPPLIWRKRSTD
jgi:hypothetical protein